MKEHISQGEPEIIIREQARRITALEAEVASLRIELSEYLGKMVAAQDLAAWRLLLLDAMASIPGNAAPQGAVVSHVRLGGNGKNAGNGSG